MVSFPELLCVSFPLHSLILFPLADEQAQQRLQAEELDEQYQTVLRMLNATTRRAQKKELVFFLLIYFTVFYQPTCF